VATAFGAVTRTTEEQFGEASREVFQAGEQLQRGMVELMCSLVTLAAFTLCHMAKMTLIARPISHGAALPARAFCKSGMTVTSQGGS
jgi:hypothetical protein